MVTDAQKPAEVATAQQASMRQPRIIKAMPMLAMESKVAGTRSSKIVDPGVFAAAAERLGGFTAVSRACWTLSTSSTVELCHLPPVLNLLRRRRRALRLGDDALPKGVCGVPVGVVKQQRRQASAHVPFHLARRHAQGEVCAQAVQRILILVSGLLNQEVG